MLGTGEVLSTWQIALLTTFVGSANETKRTRRVTVDKELMASGLSRHPPKTLINKLSPFEI